MDLLLSSLERLFIFLLIGSLVFAINQLALYLLADRLLKYKGDLAKLSYFLLFEHRITGYNSLDTIRKRVDRKVKPLWYIRGGLGELSEGASLGFTGDSVSEDSLDYCYDLVASSVGVYLTTTVTQGTANSAITAMAEESVLNYLESNLPDGFTTLYNRLRNLWVLSLPILLGVTLYITR